MPLKVFVGATLHNFALFQDKNLIDITQGTEAVRDHDHRAIHDQLVQRVHDLGLGLNVEGCSGLVEDQDGGVAQESTGNGNPLPLTTGEVLALLTYGGIVAFRQVYDGLVDIGFFGDFNDLLHAGSGLADGDVLANGTLKEDRVLQHHADIVAQYVQGIQAGIHAVDFNHALLNIVEARDQLDQRGFAAAGEADQSDPPARAEMQIDAL